MSDLAALFLCIAGVVLAAQAVYSHKVWPRLRKRMRTGRVPALIYPPRNAKQAITLRDVKPYQFPPLKFRTSTRMEMGLKRLDDSNWLTIDSKYLPEHNLRLNLLEECRSNVIQCLPPSMPACHEVLSLAVSFLTSRFPLQFTTSYTLSGPVIHSHVTGETFPIGPRCANPLEVAALLSMEDFNILIKSPETGEYCLMASATLFPAGWKLQERIGMSMACLHGPVPGWKEKLGAHVNRYFDHLTPKTSMERTNLFIQTTSELFQDEPEVITTSSSSLTLTTSPDSDYESSLKLEQVTVRRERQTFTRLPKTGAVLFTVRTYMTPLTELNNDELLALRSQVWGWEEEIRMYKGWAIWGELVEKWCEGRIGKRDESEVTVKRGGCPFPT